MRRRSLLALAAGIGGLSGCSALGVEPFGSRDAGTPTDEPRSSTPTGTPDLPYSAPTADGNVESARDIRIHNRRAETAFVTLVVEDGERTIYVDSRAIPPGATVVHDALVRREGVYRVLFETSRGARTVHGWAVGDDWLGSRLTAEVTDDGVDTRQLAICAPDCPPIGTSGESIDLPREDNTDPGREVVGALGVRNDLSETAPVDISVARDGRTLLDYRYDLPAGVTALIPVAREHGAYDLAIETDAGSLARTWHLPEETYPNLRVGREGPTPECDRDSLRVTGVRNADGRAHRVDLRLRADGRTAADRSLYVPANGFVNHPTVGARGESLTLEVRVDDRSLVGNWTLCPPPSLRILVLDELIFLRSEKSIILSNDPGSGA